MLTMKITCISASNIEVARQNSASTRACALVGELLAEENLPDLEVDILSLIDFDLIPCRMCGGCVKAGSCIHDEAFNAVYDRLKAADALFLVVPHYAPIPSKVMILLEKLEEMAYLGWVQDPTYPLPLSGKPVGVIGHGGQGSEALRYYKTALLDPVSGALASVGMKVVSAGEDWPNGVTFGIKSLRKREGSVFVEIEHNWEEVRGKIAPLVRNMAEVLSHKGL
jgi:multimeric flavodoxin WrbA